MPETSIFDFSKDSAPEKLITGANEPDYRSWAEDATQAIQEKMNRRMDGMKLNLTLQERRAVEDIENAILTADTDSLEDQIRKFADDPKSGESIMLTVVDDLQVVGIDGHWDYATYVTIDSWLKLAGSKKPTKVNFANAAKPSGEFTLAKNNHDWTTTFLTFSTHKSPFTVREEKRSMLGSHHLTGQPVQDALEGIRDDGLLKSRPS